MAALREWRHALEVFTETIGPSWAGVAYLLATSRMLAQEFTSDEFPEVIKLVKLVNHGQCQVDTWEFDVDTKTDTLYKLLMPRLPLELATHFRRVGSTNGVELYKRVVRKIGPPQKNDAFTWATRSEDSVEKAHSKTSARPAGS